MTDFPFISVVVPTYRRPMLLARCLDALLAQILPSSDFEIIVVSDGPDIETKRVVEQFVQRRSHAIRYYALGGRRGPAAARNVGWQNAKGELIAFTDDDCIPDRDWLQKFQYAYQFNELTHVAFHGRTVVPIPRIPTDYEANVSNLERAEFITANCAVTKQALVEARGFDETFARAWREDSDLQFTLIRRKIPIIPVNAVVTHPVRKAPWGVCLKEEKKGMYDALLYKKHPRLYRRKIQALHLRNYYLMIILFITFVVAIMQESTWVATASAAAWIFLWGRFTIMRLATTSHAFRDISEMAITSAIIPFLSVYWRCYGIVKFRAPLLFSFLL